MHQVREIIERSRAGEGVVKWSGGAPFIVALQPDKHVHLNFWGSPFVPTPPLLSPMHTHDYGFTSQVLFGTLYNTRHQVAPTVDGEYMRYAIDDSDWNRLLKFRSTGQRMTILRSSTTEERGTYEMDPRDWHSTRVIAPAISYLNMWDHAPLDYSTLQKVGLPPYENANRYVDPARMADLWVYVDAMCNLAGIR